MGPGVTGEERGSFFSPCRMRQLALFGRRRHGVVVAAPPPDRPDPADGLAQRGADLDGGVAVAAAEAGDGPPDGARKVARNAGRSHRTP